MQEPIYECSYNSFIGIHPKLETTQIPFNECEWQNKGQRPIRIAKLYVSGSWWFPLPASSVGHVAVEHLEYNSGPVLWKMFLPVAVSLS